MWPKTQIVPVAVRLHLRQIPLYPLQIGYKKRGQSGIEVSDWWPHLSTCIDDLAVVRSMWTTDNDHAAQLQFHSIGAVSLAILILQQLRC